MCIKIKNRHVKMKNKWESCNYDQNDTWGLYGDYEAIPG